MTVRALVRRAGTAPDLDGVEERVGDSTEAQVLRDVLSGADAVVTTVHPMGSDRATQERIGVEGNGQVARIAAELGVGRLVHISTAAAYDRSPGVGDVDESSDLVGVATGAPGPDDGACTAVNVVAGSATTRDYVETVTGALGVDPVWDDEPAWTGVLHAELARSWGWTPRVGLAEALAEITAGLRG